MQRLVLALGLSALAVGTLPAQGQPGSPASAAVAATATVGDLIPLGDQLNVDGEKQFRGMTKVLVPTVLVRLATRGSLSVVNQGRYFQTDGQTVKAKGKFVVAGLDKEYAQSLARQLHDDFVARLRSAGYTVLTYDDVKDNPEVAGMKRYKPDDDYGMPTGGPPVSKNTYVVAFPSDAQAIDPPFQGYAWGFRKVSKELDAALLVPEYVVDAPLLTGSKRHGVASRGASVSVFPEMMVNAYVPMATAKGGYGSIRLKSPLGDVADEVGQIGDAKDDSPKFANAIAAGLSELSALGTDLQSKSGIWGMKLNRPAYTAGVLRGGLSFNAAAVQAMAAEKAK
ncbi:MAG: hypothetical protein ACXWZS_13990 [Gemmatirosa sp.]